MSDKYLDLVNSGFTKKLAKTLGLPRPAKLRRQGLDPDPVPVSGTVVVLGKGQDADAVANLLLEWDLDVRRTAPPSGKVHGIILVLTELQTPAQMSPIALAAGSLLRSLAPHGRVVTISRDPAATEDVAAAATQAGVDGFLRSLAKEMRAGATANGILLGRGVGISAPSVASALHFYLSVKSAFVAGQFLTVTSERGNPATRSDPAATEDVAAAATQAGVDGFLRSLAKEMRAGATANGILLGRGVGISAPSVASALHFYLSVKSAFVAGQFLTVTSERGNPAT